MDKEILSNLINQKYSQREIAKRLNISQSSVRWWLKKHNLNTFKGPKGKFPKDYVKDRKCKCGETDPDKFYGNKTQICSKCHNQYQIKKGRETTLRAKLYLGGKCVKCSYDKCIAALDIHHLDPTQKDPNFVGHRSWSWKRLEKELETCILVCKNCHAEIHYYQRDIV
jgi:hypothetical protein